MNSVKRARIPALDGFRGLGVTVIIATHLPLASEGLLYNGLWHVNQYFRIGHVVLDVFFSISGFFITRLLLAEREAKGRISLKTFYTRRAMRIMPIYYLTLFCCVFIFSMRTPETLSLLTQTFNFYHPLYPTPNPLEHTWSLSVEEQFYFFWPLFISLVPLPLLSVVAGRVLPLVAVAWGLFLAVLTASSDQAMSGNLVYMSPFTRMISLSLGAWLAAREFEGRPFCGKQCLLLGASGVGILLADLACRHFGLIRDQALYWTIALASYGMISVSFTATIIFDRGRLARAIRSLLTLPLFLALGRLSYGLYLYHLPVLFYFGLNDAAVNGGTMPLVRIIEALAITFLIAVTSFYFIEKPILAMRPSSKRRTIKSERMSPHASVQQA